MFRNFMDELHNTSVNQGVSPDHHATTTSHLHMDYMPTKGMEFESEDFAYSFYNNYAKIVGFSIRKEYFNTCKVTGRVTSRKFVCSKEGFRKNDKRDCKTKKPRAETRCGCEACLVIVLNKKIDKYVVTNFVAEHNHLLHLPETTHMMPSQRNVSLAQTVEIDLADESGMQVKTSLKYMGKRFGGKENLGYTRQDLKNYLRTKRQRDLEFGEAGNLMRYFSQKVKENSSFYYAVQLDVEEQITNIFWADAEMIIDYGYFGDVVTFDTTYGTNRDGRPLAVFLGLNHHRETVVFGAALMYDETIASFEWLFETFVEVMAEKKPVTIFTDQDSAMAAAISEVMPETYHALCSWHMWQNANRHLGHLLKEGSGFTGDFLACIYEYDDENQFLYAWNTLLEEHNLFENKWLNDLFKLKEKWSQAYVKRTFTEGMRTTQLSESFNSDLKNCLKSNLNVMRFFTLFEDVVSDKRYKTLEAEYNARQKLPRVMMRRSPILTQAATVYTPKIFEDFFQIEVDELMALFIKERLENQSTMTYTVGVFDKCKEYKVVGCFSDQTVTCSCRKFQTFGILCAHALKVLDVMDIKTIPNKYILKRWTREGRNGNVTNMTEANMQPKENLESADRHRYLSTIYNELVKDACESKEGFDLLNEAAKDLKGRLVKVKKTEPNGQKKKETFSNDVTIIPKGIKKREISHKGKRPKAWMEKMKKPKNKGSKKKKTNENHSQDKETIMDPTIQPVMLSPSNCFQSSVDCRNFFQSSLLASNKPYNQENEPDYSQVYFDHALRMDGNKHYIDFLGNEK